VSIKDNLPTRGIPTTMGSRLLADWVPDRDAVAVERLRAGGAVLLGKTNTSEFGWKGDAGNLLAGPTCNPWNLDLTSGGSSGRAAAGTAVALGVAALGADGAGSLRIPGSFCGVVGYKPAQGNVPVYPNSGIGILSHHGVIARGVADVACVLESIAGLARPAVRPRAVDGTSRRTLDYGSAHSLQPDARICGYRARGSDLVGAAVLAFEEQDCHFEEIDPGARRPARGHLDSHGHVPRDTARGRPRCGARLDRSWEARAGPRGTSPFRSRCRARASAAHRERVSALMSAYDLLVTPTMPCTAFRLGLDRPESVAGRPTREFQWTPFTYPFNLTGHPRHFPAFGLTRDALPVGMQIVGPWRRDDLVLWAAAAFEAAHPWRSLAPLA
jgi:aspartyl-tRNA(Asn)/glutamyl-tRNA(Gln) amidotransferase subunit A